MRSSTLAPPCDRCGRPAAYPSGGHGVLGSDRMGDRPWARIYDAVAS